MTKTQAGTATVAGQNARRRRTFGALAFLAAVAASWSAFLWTQLIASRSGGLPFCAFGGEGCAELWDGGFASAVHTATGLPIAGWGVVWGLVAFVLPLGALAAPSEGRRAALFEAATAVTAAAGGLGVLVMLAVSAQAGLFCSSCAVTYVVTAAYVAVALPRLLATGERPGGRALATAAGVAAVAWLLLLYPGLHTPQSLARSGEAALAAAVGTGAPSSSAPPSPAAAAPGPAVAPSAGSGGPVKATATPVEGAGALLSNLMANLDPAAQQALADSLYIYTSSPDVPAETPRAVHGPATAPIHITEFSDVLCSHCAALHQTLQYLHEVLPQGSFSVDSRNFPLDGNCNRFIPVRGPESVRCLGARARICFEGTTAAEEVSGALFARQSELTPELLREIVAPHMPPADFERCVASPETSAKLTADVDYAWRFRPDGTPLVLVNGRQGTSFGPFLYALVVSGGDPGHPAFGALPPPNPVAHAH